MTRETMRPFILFGGFAILFVAFVALLLRVLPGGEGPFEYMVAGTFATALALVVMFVIMARQRSLKPPVSSRTVRRSARSS